VFVRSGPWSTETDENGGKLRLVFGTRPNLRVNKRVFDVFRENYTFSSHFDKIPTTLWDQQLHPFEAYA